MLCSTQKEYFMQAQQLSSRTVSVTLFFSLLFHLALLFFLLVNHSPKQKKHLFGLQEKKQHQWASRNAKTGAPIFFMPTPPAVAHKAITQKQQSHTPVTPQKPTNQIEKKRSPFVKKRLQSVFAPTSPQTEPPTVTHRAMAQRRVDKNPTKLLAKRKDGHTQRQQSAKPNLLQIANGFLDHMKKNGKSRVNVIGNDNAKPTEQQLREERYLERLNACIHNSYSIHRKQAPYLGREKKEMHIRVSLNKLGNLIDLQLLDSCGSRHVDQFILFLFRDAASSFPPLPSYVKHDPYTLNYTIFVNNKTSTPIQALFN